MSVETIKDSYKDFASRWRTMRDCYEGQHAIHAGGEIYLPRLGGQSDDEYQAYKKRAMYHNAVCRTIQALNGQLFRKDPVIESGADISRFVNDIDLNGTSLHTFAQKCGNSLLTVGRSIVLVEFNSYDTAPLSQADVLLNNRRPYLTEYKTEALINWRTQGVNGKDVLVMAVLQETREIQKSEFESIYVKVYRSLTLDDGRYTQKIWVPNAKGEYEIESEIVPLMNGQPMPYIPLFVYGVTGQEIEPQNPPLLNLALINLAHYMTSADLEHGAHYAGLPTAVVSGVTKDDGESFLIGSQTAWVFGDPQAKATYLEFTGQGLQALEARMQKKEEQMVAQGARMLAQEKRVAETAETELIRRGGELATLAGISLALSELITESFKVLLEWAGVKTDFNYVVNRDFVPGGMDAQELTALVGALQTGSISQQTFFEALQDGEMVRDTLTYEEEQDRLAMQPLSVNV